ncbi:hypothetical protein ABVT39_024537 [Epinephelus coioides]
MRKTEKAWTDLVTVSQSDFEARVREGLVPAALLPLSPTTPPVVAQPPTKKHKTPIMQIRTLTPAAEITTISMTSLPTIAKVTEKAITNSPIETDNLKTTLAPSTPEAISSPVPKLEHDVYDDYENEEDLQPLTREINQDVVFKPRQRSMRLVFDDLWEVASHNEWYKWAQYTAKGMTSGECIVCASAPTVLPTVVPEIYTFAGCAAAT